MTWSGIRNVVRPALSIYVGPWRWVARRPSVPGTDPQGFAYVGVMALVMSNQTSVTVSLVHPTTIRGRRGRDEDVVVIRFWADEPQALVRAAGVRLVAAPARAGGADAD